MKAVASPAPSAARRLAPWVAIAAVWGGGAQACVDGTRAERVAAEARAALGSGEVARVGAVVLRQSLVRDVALAQHVSAREALDGLVYDALLDEAAPSRDLPDRAALGWKETCALARRIPDEFSVASRAAGPPRDEELASLRVTHAVVIRSSQVGDSTAKTLAQIIREAVAAARDSPDFEKRAAAVPHGMLRIVVERIGPFGADGLLGSGATLDPAFVAASFALGSPGSISPVVETRFGWHVVRLEARDVPPENEIASRRDRESTSVVELRARMALAALLLVRRGKERVEVSSAAEQLMSTAFGGVP